MLMLFFSPCFNSKLCVKLIGSSSEGIAHTFVVRATSMDPCTVIYFLCTLLQILQVFFPNFQLSQMTVFLLACNMLFFSSNSANHSIPITFSVGQCCRLIMHCVKLFPFTVCKISASLFSSNVFLFLEKVQISVSSLPSRQRLLSMPPHSLFFE